jgi:hypothetical protein
MSRTASLLSAGRTKAPTGFAVAVSERAVKQHWAGPDSATIESQAKSPRTPGWGLAVDSPPPAA